MGGGVLASGSSRDSVREFTAWSTSEHRTCQRPTPAVGGLLLTNSAAPGTYTTNSLVPKPEIDKRFLPKSTKGS